jgi:hypothetical protein
MVDPPHLLHGLSDLSKRKNVPAIADSATDHLRALGGQLAHVGDHRYSSGRHLLRCPSRVPLNRRAKATGSDDEDQWRHSVK